MPSWGEILTEVQQSAAEHAGQPDIDGIRRRYLTRLHDLTDRDLIIYYADWTGPVAQPGTAIVLGDMQGMMEVCRGLRGPDLDLIIHSPGGTPEATASIVRYLRRRYTRIRVFVPLAAMSAATMWALACDEIVMGKHSQLGPIDPQILMPQGQFPARSIIEQFDRAKREIAEDASVLGAWVPILQQYGPSLLELCERAEKLAKGLVEEWLRTYSLSEDPDGAAKAAAIAQWFADYPTHQSHSMGITREQARDQGLNITDLEADQELQDAVLSVHHATILTFQGPAVKIIENHLGRAFVQMTQTLQIPLQLAIPGQQGPPQSSATSPRPAD